MKSQIAIIFMMVIIGGSISDVSAEIRSTDFRMPFAVLSCGSSLMASSSYHLSQVTGQPTPVTSRDAIPLSINYFFYPGVEYLFDPDSDDDGISNGVEDSNNNNIVDVDETDPYNIDSDSDGIQDGTEKGLTLLDIGFGTDFEVFQPDLDNMSTTDPLDADTDNDGFEDGEEDLNINGRVDTGETDPNVVESAIPAISASGMFVFFVVLATSGIVLIARRSKSQLMKNNSAIHTINSDKIRGFDCP